MLLSLWARRCMWIARNNTRPGTALAATARRLLSERPGQQQSTTDNASPASSATAGLDSHTAPPAAADAAASSGARTPSALQSQHASMPPQSLDLFRAILQLRALNAEIDAAFPDERSAHASSSVELHRNPQWVRAHLKAKRLLASCIQELQWELRHVHSRAQCTRDQWETMIWTAKHLHLFPQASQLLEIALAHLTRAETLWRKRNRLDWAHKRALSFLAEREVNLVIECVARAPETPTIHAHDGTLSVPSKHDLRAAMLPALDEAAKVLASLHSHAVVHSLDLSGASSVLLNVFARLVSPPPPSQAKSPADLAAADAAAQAIRARYDQCHPKQPKLHATMLGAYLRLGAHESMKRLLVMVESQAAKEGQPVLAACYGAMLSSVFQQLEVAEVGSDAASSLVQQAERYWKRAKISPMLDARATWTMMRTCSAVWDVARTQSVLMEAVALEDELLATAAYPLASRETNAATAAVASFGAAGPVYADPACFSLLLHTYATRCSDPAAHFAAAQAAWDLMLARYVSTRPRASSGAASLFGEVQWSKTFLPGETPNIDRSRRLRPTRGAIDSWVSFLSLVCTGSSSTASLPQKHQAERNLHALWRELTPQMKREHHNIVLALFKAGTQVPEADSAQTDPPTPSSRLSSLHSLATDLSRQGLWTPRTLTAWLTLSASPAFASRSSTAGHERAEHVWGLFAAHGIAPSAKSYAALMAAQLRSVASGEIAPGSPQGEQMLRRVEETWWTLRSASHQARESASTAGVAGTAAVPAAFGSASSAAAVPASAPSLAPPFAFQVSDFAAVFRAMARRTPPVAAAPLSPNGSPAAAAAPLTLKIAVPLDAAGVGGDADPSVTVTLPPPASSSSPSVAAPTAPAVHARALLSPHIPYDFVQRWISRARVAGLWEQVRSQAQVQSIVYGSSAAAAAAGASRRQIATAARSRLRSIARGYARARPGEIVQSVEEIVSQLAQSKAQLNAAAAVGDKAGDKTSAVSASKKRAMRRAAIKKLRRAGATTAATDKPGTIASTASVASKHDR